MAIDNVLQKGVKVTLDKERTITYPMLAMGYLADVYGSIGEAFEAFQSVTPKAKPGTGKDKGKQVAESWKLDMKAIKVITHFITAGLLAEDETITFAEVSMVLDMNNMSDAITAVSTALMAYMPKPKAGETDPQAGPKK